MVEIIFKQDIEKSKIDALLYFLKSMDIDAELKLSETASNTKKDKFSLSSGIWENYKIEGDELRIQSWKRSK